MYKAQLLKALGGLRRNHKIKNLMDLVKEME